eukprot:TRINITY_DN7718_c0_g1_i8.p1 TRINITY_DN7718_c0_g1~~TRINITY_DN7718_c0_g1_i8.p1  ORF type:complete len:943 (+),score=129.18 TRINITY_DN7718_c0_g1_i8:139-2829(+)
MSAPCQSIDKLNVILSGGPVGGGDAFLFRRGDTFHGSVYALNNVQGTQGNPITFGAYGDNLMPQPIISATTLISTPWTNSNNNVWSSSLINKNISADGISNVFVNGAKMTWARSPNLSQAPEDRYFTITASTSMNTFQSRDVLDPSGTWNGAVVRVRLYLWSVTTRTVQSHTFDGTTATFTFTQPFNDGYQPITGWKFFLENKLVAVDEPGEWSFDASSSTLSLSSLVDPNTLTVEASIYPYAFQFVNSNYITFSDLHFHGQMHSAIIGNTGPTSRYIQILNCTFTDQEYAGLQIGSVSNLLITNSSFSGMQNSGINLYGSSVSVIGNRFYSIGLVQGHQNQGGGVGIQLVGANNVISYNHIYDISYNGIVFTNSRDASIYNNYVTRCTLTMSDGGAIYSYGTETLGGVVKDNIVTDIFSLPWDGFTPEDEDPLNNGIYIDNWCNNVTISGNTVVNIHNSNLFTNSYNHTWSNNLLIGEGSGGSVIGVNEMSGNNVVNNVYINNTIYIRSPLGLGVLSENSNVRSTTSHMASYAKNIYCNPYGSIFFSWDNAGYAGARGWESWQSVNRDQGSSLCNLQQLQQPRFSTLGKINNVISVLNQNPTFNTSTSSWGCDRCTLTWLSSSSSSSSPFPSFPAAMITLRDPSILNMQFQQGGLQVTQGQTYRIRFTATATQETAWFTGLQMDHSPWASPAGALLTFIIPGGLRPRNFEEIFEATFTDTIMINFSGKFPSSNTSIYITNMFFEQVTMSPQTWDYVAINPSSSPTIISLPSNISFSTLDGSGTYACFIIIPPWSSKLLVYKAMHNISSCTAPASSSSSSSSSSSFITSTTFSASSSPTSTSFSASSSPTSTSFSSSTSLSPSPPVPSSSNRNAYSAAVKLIMATVGLVLFIIACV